MDRLMLIIPSSLSWIILGLIVKLVLCIFTMYVLNYTGLWPALGVFRQWWRGSIQTFMISPPISNWILGMASPKKGTTLIGKWNWQVLSNQGGLVYVQWLFIKSLSHRTQVVGSYECLSAHSLCIVFIWRTRTANYKWIPYFSPQS